MVIEYVLIIGHTEAPVAATVCEQSHAIQHGYLQANDASVEAANYCTTVRQIITF